MRYDIKPISVNRAWQGKRFKTPEYKSYEKHLGMLLKPIKIDLNAKLKVSIHYGFSSRLSDIDNPCKMILDIMQKKYGFDDKNIFELNQTKEIVPKGKEFIELEISEIKNKFKNGL